MTLTVAERARAPIIELRYALPWYFARQASSMMSLIALNSSSERKMPPKQPCRCLSNRAYSQPNFRHRCRMASRETRILRRASRSSTSRKLNQNR